MKIEGNSVLSKNNADKQCGMVLTSILLEVPMIARNPEHFRRCLHPAARPRRGLDRKGSRCLPGFARRGVLSAKLREIPTLGWYLGRPV